MQRCLFILVIISLYSHAQGVDWEKNVPGKFFIVGHECKHCHSTPKIAAFKTDAVFDVVRQLPIIKQPVGYDLHEQMRATTHNNILQGSVVFKFYSYYSYQKGPVEQSTEPESFSIIINQQENLVNKKSLIEFHLPSQTKSSDPWANLLPMFTDTLELEYKTLNGYEVGEAFDSGWRYRVWVVNPKRLKFFRHVTQEEYLGYWLGKLQYDIDELENGIAEIKKAPEAFPEVDLSSVPDSLRDKITKTLAEAKKGADEAMKSVQPEMEKGLRQNEKLLAFYKKKQAYYQQMFKTMTPEKRKAPAYFAYYKHDALVVDQNGNTVENIEGNMQNEPYEGRETLSDVPILPIYTFIKEPFSKVIPKTGFQLITVVNSYDDDKNDLKTFIKNEGILKLNYKALADLMYK